MIVYNGWVSFLKCQLNSCFHASCTCIPSLKCTFCHHWIFKPSPHTPFNQPQITPYKISNCTSFCKMKIVRSSRLERWCQATITQDRRIPDQKHNKMKRRKTMIYTYQWQATTARKTPQSPTTSVSYNNEKNTTKSTRMTRKSQRQWQSCRK